jgi:hypothetical protein
MEKLCTIEFSSSSSSEREREREESQREEEEGAKESTNGATVSQKAVSCTLNNRWVIGVTTGS